MTPEHYLDHADRLLREPANYTRGLWPRACTWLIRLAIEGAVDDHWMAVNPAMREVARRAQLLVLEQSAGAETARRVSLLWSGLSRAGHNHAYELAPTAGELRRWEQEARSLVTNLRPPTSDLSQSRGG